MEKIAVQFDNAPELVNGQLAALVELNELQLAAVGGGTGEATPA